MEVSSHQSFDQLSKSVIDLLRTFKGLRDEVILRHGNRAKELTDICYQLHLDFYKHMRMISSISNDSTSSIGIILLELKIAERCKNFDIDTSTEIKISAEKLSEIVTSYKNRNDLMLSRITTVTEEVELEQKSLNSDRPNFDFIKQCGLTKTCELLENSPNNFALVGRFFLDAVATAVNGIFRLINRRRTEKFDNISEILGKLSKKLETLSNASNIFFCSFEETLQLLQNYNIDANRLLEFSAKPPSERLNTRLIMMAGDMIPGTKDLLDKFQAIKEDAICNERDLRLALNLIDPCRMIKY